MEVIAYKYILVISKGPVFQVYTVFRCVCVCVLQMSPAQHCYLLLVVSLPLLVWLPLEVWHQ